MKTYEAMLLLDNREVKNGWETLKEKVDGILTKYGANILVAKRWDERKLAYEIKKQKRATYYLAYLEADPESIGNMSRSLKLSGPVLRHLVLRCEEVPADAYEPEKEFELESSDDAGAAEKESAEQPEATEETGAAEPTGEAETEPTGEASEETPPEQAEASPDEGSATETGRDTDEENDKQGGGPVPS